MAGLKKAVVMCSCCRRAVQEAGRTRSLDESREAGIGFRGLSVSVKGPYPGGSRASVSVWVWRGSQVVRQRSANSPGSFAPSCAFLQLVVRQ